MGEENEERGATLSKQTLKGSRIFCGKGELYIKGRVRVEQGED